MASSAPSPSHEVEADVEQQQRGHHHPRESQDRGRGVQQELSAAVPRPPFAEPRGIHLTRKDFRQQGRTCVRSLITGYVMIDFYFPSPLLSNLTQTDEVHFEIWNN